MLHLKKNTEQLGGIFDALAKFYSWKYLLYERSGRNLLSGYIIAGNVYKSTHIY